MHTTSPTTPNTRPLLALALASCLGAAALLSLPGCAVQRGQESAGAYMDEAAITASIKARFVEDKQVDAGAISVETLKGTVILSGFAKSATERSMAETIARGVKGVVGVNNQIVVRP